MIWYLWVHALTEAWSLWCPYENVWTRYGLYGRYEIVMIVMGRYDLG